MYALTNTVSIRTLIYEYDIETLWLLRHNVCLCGGKDSRWHADEYCAGEARRHVIGRQSASVRLCVDGRGCCAANARTAARLRKTWQQVIGRLIARYYVDGTQRGTIYKRARRHMREKRDAVLKRRNGKRCVDVIIKKKK